MTRRLIGPLIFAQAAGVATGSSGSEDGYLLWGFILLAIAMGLLCLELFVPSGGMIAVLAGLAVIGSVVSFFKYDSTWGLVALGLDLVLLPIIVIFGVRIWMNSPLGRRFVLGGRQMQAAEDAEAEGTGVRLGPAEAERRARLQAMADLIGARGVAITALRPVGTVRIGKQRVDALAETGIIESGERIVVDEAFDN